jgi:hypothetical protein
MEENYEGMLRKKRRRGIPKTLEEEMGEEYERIQKYIDKYGEEPPC